MRWEKEDLPSFPLHWKRGKRVGRKWNKEKVDIEDKLNFWLNLLLLCSCGDLAKLDQNKSLNFQLSLILPYSVQM